jgi:hypothetical protein
LVIFIIKILGIEILNNCAFTTIFKFFFIFSTGVDVIKDLAKRDTHVIRYDFVGLKPQEDPEECTLDDEFKPPAERSSVQTMIELGRKKPRHKRIYKPMTGLGFNPLIR